MNREQAIKAVADKIGLSGPFTNNLVDAMVEVGVLKLDVPCVSVPCVSSDGRKDGTGNAIVREDTMIETLRMAGYEVRER
jgi:hypothetical protein